MSDEIKEFECMECFNEWTGRVLTACPECGCSDLVQETDGELWRKPIIHKGKEH